MPSIKNTRKRNVKEMAELLKKLETSSDKTAQKLDEMTSKLSDFVDDLSKAKKEEQRKTQKKEDDDKEEQYRKDLEDALEVLEEGERRTKREKIEQLKKEAKGKRKEQEKYAEAGAAFESGDFFGGLFAAMFAGKKQKKKEKKLPEEEEAENLQKELDLEAKQKEKAKFKEKEEKARQTIVGTAPTPVKSNVAEEQIVGEESKLKEEDKLKIQEKSEKDLGDIDNQLSDISKIWISPLSVTVVDVSDSVIEKIGKGLPKVNTGGLFDVVPALGELFSGFKTKFMKIPEFLEGISGKLKTIEEGLASKFKSFFKGAGDLVEQTGSKITDAAKDATKTVAKVGAEVTEIGSEAVETATKTVAKVGADVAEKGAVKGLTGGVPVLGPLVGAGIGAYSDIKKGESLRKTAALATGTFLGGVAGEVTGGAAGSLASPAGTVIGEIGGGIAGMEGGRLAAGALYDKFPGITKTVTGLPTKIAGAGKMAIDFAQSRGILTPDQLDALMAVASGESGFKPRSESSYSNTSNKRLRNLPGFGSRLQDLSDDQLTELKKNDEAFFNKVYGGRLGNEANEGYKYRGRGIVQLTGKDNYKKYGDLLGVDLINNPDLANNPDIAAKIAVLFAERSVKGKITEGVQAFEDISKAVAGESFTKQLEHNPEVATQKLKSFQEYQAARLTPQPTAPQTGVNVNAAIAGERAKETPTQPIVISQNTTNVSGGGTQGSPKPDARDEIRNTQNTDAFGAYNALKVT